MFEAHITKTAKGYSPKDQWSVFDKEVVGAASLPELRAELAKRYGKSWRNRRPMYCDMPDGRTVKIGYVVGFRNESQNRDKSSGRDCYIEQDWVSIRRCEWTDMEGGG